MQLDRTSMIAIALTVVVLVLFNVSIYDREQIISNGEILFLELAPVDPRSLMQGDYMRLRYAVEDSVPVDELQDHQRRGFLVLRGDDGNVARFVRIDDGESLEQGERLVRFHRLGGLAAVFAGTRQIKIVPDSFFFQEGHRELYEDARYGVFQFDDRGRYLLVGLADGDRVPIESRLHGMRQSARGKAI